MLSRGLHDGVAWASHSHLQSPIEFSLKDLDFIFKPLQPMDSIGTLKLENNLYQSLYQHTFFLCCSHAVLQILGIDTFLFASLAEVETLTQPLSLPLMVMLCEFHSSESSFCCS